MDIGCTYPRVDCFALAIAAEVGLKVRRELISDGSLWHPRRALGRSVRKALSSDNALMRKVCGKGCGQERRDRVNDWQYEAGAAILIRPCRQHCSEQVISIDSHSCLVHPSERVA